MKIELITDVLALEQAMNAFAYGASCPAELRDKIAAIPASERVNRGAQVLYAHYDQLDDAGKKACGQLFCYAANMGWSAFNEQHKSTDVVALIEKDLSGKPTGEAVDWPQPQVGFRAEAKDWRLPEVVEEDDATVSTGTGESSDVEGATAPDDEGAGSASSSAEG